MRANRKTLFASLLVAVATVVSFVGFSVPAQASTTVSGSVECATTNVMGVWVDASSGSDGWASTSPGGGAAQSVTWHYGLSSNTSYKLYVGCGGTPQSWSLTASSNWLSGSGHSLLCYDVPGVSGYGHCY